MMDVRWLRIGRIFAWVNAAGYIVASVVSLLLNFGITSPAEPDFIEGDELANIGKFLDHYLAIWPQDFAATLFFGIAFLSLLPIGLALKEILGRDKAGVSLGASSLFAAGIIGFLNQLVSIGISSQAVRTARFPEVETRIAFLAAHHLGNSITAWVGLGFFLTAGVGVILLSMETRGSERLSRGWASLGIVVGILYLAGIVFGAGQEMTTLPIFRTLFELLILVGGAVLAPIWAIWLAMQLKSLRPQEER